MRFAPGAFKIAGITGVLAVPAYFITPWLVLGLVGVGGFILWFYRDPERKIPLEGFVAPADGRIREIKSEEGSVRISIFMNVTDVHVNRAPTRGTVQKLIHSPGAHRPAFSKESDRNERLTIYFEAYSITLTAGAFARRITPYVSVGEGVDRGQRIGHIAFGSRVDVVLPDQINADDILVSAGEKVRAGESIIAMNSSVREHTS